MEPLARWSQEDSRATEEGGKAENPFKQCSLDLTREELLHAIDFEISQRETLTSKHGINVWGIIGVTVALLWACVNEMAERPHNWTNTLLVFFAAFWCLTQVVSRFTNRLGWGGIVKAKEERGKTLQQVVLLSGVDPGTLPYYFLETDLALALSAYLGTKGFHLLSAVACIFYTLALLLLVVYWLVTRIRVPLETEESVLPPVRSLRHRTVIILFWVFVFTVVCLAIGTVVRAWPNLGKENIRLGCILAALATVISFSVRYCRPPIDLTELRSLRSRLAFGLVDLPKARAEAEGILMGPARQNYLSAKADEVVAALDARTRRAQNVAARMDRVISLAEELKTKPGDAKLLNEASLEMRFAFRRSNSDLNAIAAYLARVQKLRSGLLLRAKVARTTLEFSPQQVNSVLSRVDAAARGSDAALAEVGSRFDRFKSAFERLQELLKDFPGNKGALMTWNEVVQVLFKD